ncbi:MAG: YdcF family protein [Armatimonadetes bacterium]|nr:YdcF family protein [Armatimonadota bacterium]
MLLGWSALHVVVIVWDGLTDELEPSDLAVVLGSKVERDGTPSRRLKTRLDRALELYRDHMVGKILVSGGLPAEGHHEAEVVAKYLIETGVPAQDVLLDHGGCTTAETARKQVFSKMHRVLPEVRRLVDGSKGIVDLDIGPNPPSGPSKPSSASSTPPPSRDVSRLVPLPRAICSAPGRVLWPYCGRCRLVSHSSCPSPERSAAAPGCSTCSDTRVRLRTNFSSALPRSTWSGNPERVGQSLRLRRVNSASRQRTASRPFGGPPGVRVQEQRTWVRGLELGRQNPHSYPSAARS